MKKIIGFLGLVCLVMGSSVADDQPTRDPQNVSFVSKKAILFADSVSYDQNGESVHARGRVEVVYDNQLLVCDQLTYDRPKDLIMARGHVWIKDAMGHITFMEKADISSDFNRADVSEIRTLMTDNSRLAANHMHRESIKENRLDKVVYSPCNLCPTEKHGKQPLWQLKATHVLWNEEADDIEYTDTILEFGGVPIFYTPYMRHPGPRVKRRSGFLAPFAGGASGLGGVFGVPYFWAIDDQKDMTLTPVITGESPLFAMEYRQRFQKGEFALDWSLTRGRFKKGPSEHEPKKDRLRGHVHSKLLYDINENWRGGFDVTRTMDDTYFRRYRFLNQTHDSFLTSRAFAEHFTVRDYSVIEAMTFQGMRDEDRSSLIPYIAPSAETHLIRKLGFMPGNWFTDASLLNLGRKEGGMMQRLSGTTGWEMMHITHAGLIVEPRVQVRQDLYQIEKYTFTSRPGDKFTGQQGRFVPQAMTHLRYPFVRYIDQARVVVEPIVGGVITPKQNIRHKIPNEDDTIFELSDANIFSPSRFAGLDRLDPGSRLNWGLRTLLLSTDFSNSEIFVGQSYAFHTPGAGFENSGLEHKLSDYIARIRINYTSWMTLESRGLFDRSDLSAKREETTLQVGQPILRFGVTYSRLPRVTQPTFSSEQATYNVSSQVTPEWSIYGSFTKELGKHGGKLSQGLGAKYEDECFIFDTSASKTFYHDRDLKPGITVLFRVAFKTLGEFKFTSNQLGLSNERSQPKNKDEEPQVGIVPVGLAIVKGGP